MYRAAADDDFQVSRPSIVPAPWTGVLGGEGTGQGSTGQRANVVWLRNWGRILLEQHRSPWAIPIFFGYLQYSTPHSSIVFHSRAPRHQHFTFTRTVSEPITPGATLAAPATRTAPMPVPAAQAATAPVPMLAPMQSMQYPFMAYPPTSLGPRSPQV